MAAETNKMITAGDYVLLNATAITEITMQNQTVGALWLRVTEANTKPTGARLGIKVEANVVLRKEVLAELNLAITGAYVWVWLEMTGEVYFNHA